VATEKAKGKETATSPSDSPVPGFAHLSVSSPPGSPRPPPRPSAATKPSMLSSPQRGSVGDEDDDDEEDDEDEDNPFADRNAA
jgi:hypothetical protein